jgi:penicillin-binding protein 2
MTTFRDSLKSRFGVFGLLMLLVLGVLLVRLWSMQVLAGASFAAQATENRIRQIDMVAPRGRIFDRNGKPLVTSRASMAVFVEPKASEDATLMGRLSRVIGMKPSDIRHEVRSSRLGPLQARAVKLEIPMGMAAYLAEHSTDFPGISVDSVPVREYPLKTLAAHVLGYVGQISEAEIAKRTGQGDYRYGDVVGKTGAEAEFEKVLRGERGFRTVEVDAQGRLRRIINQRDPVGGHDVQLTIDSDLQAVTETALQNALSEAHRQKFPKANAGAAVVLDVTNGEVLAMASYPTYDPSQFLSGISSSQWAALTATTSAYPLNDRVIMSAYPPASTFKAITGLGALQEGFITPTTAYNAPYTWIFPGHENNKNPWWQKHDWNKNGHGVIDFTQAVAESADTYFYPLGYRFYTTPGEKLQMYARKAGFATKTGIDLPGEVSGRVPTAAWKKKYNAYVPENQGWQPGDTVNLSIGQGDMLATPLQVVQAYAGIANGGRIMQPHVLKSIIGPDGKAALSTPPKVEATLPASPPNLAALQAGLRAVVTEGTAKSTFSGFHVAVAGKTGTAQVAGKDDYAWFVGYVPAEAPKYAVAVLVEQGGHGASVAGPAARMIMAKLTGQPVKFVSGGTDASR